MDIDKMSERQYDYFMEKEKQCSEYKLGTSINKSKDNKPRVRGYVQGGGSIPFGDNNGLKGGFNLGGGVEIPLSDITFSSTINIDLTVNAFSTGSKGFDFTASSLTGDYKFLKIRDDGFFGIIGLGLYYLSASAGYVSISETNIGIKAGIGYDFTNRMFLKTCFNYNNNNDGTFKTFGNMSLGYRF
ncbi:MAG: hypothetical protein H6614_06580 [Ignavibacteriales bacterium]|nr:hypothetical protein [Ignavibacteriales bacterium]